MDNVGQQVPPVPNQAPIKATNNLNFLKIIAYGFVIVSIGISIAVGGYLLGASKSSKQTAQISVTPSVSPTPDPTANWKTYTNTQYGFSLKYPLVFIEGQAYQNLAYQGINLKNLLNGKANNLRINIYPLLKDYRLVDRAGGFVFYFDVSSRQWMHDKTTEVSKFTPKKTNGVIEAYVYNTGDVKCGQEYILMPTLGDTSIIELINEKCANDDGKNLPGYYNLTSTEILSTFKFTDQLSDMSDWKTYRGSFGAGFEIKYPGTWSVVQDPISSKPILYFYLPVNGKMGDLIIFLAVGNEPQTLGFRGTWNLLPYSIAKQDLSIGISENLIFNGFSFKRDVWKNGVVAYYTVVSKSGEEDKYFTLATGNKNGIDTIGKMVSTFKFAN